ncbi:hypothetical protein [Tautonia marina]|uniref:hypothetical protein n=1 Tax=Tautonia marina TaxID=2653855 RepID=UPI001260DAD4|nr:hypothetical protein [Tautonia marina]
MLTSVAIFYLVIKGAFLAALVKAFTSSDSLMEKPIMMAVIYTLGIAGLSYVYLNPSMLREMGISWEDRRIWLGTTFLLAALYFWLLAKFENAGALWWAILMLGLGLVIY